MAEPVKLDFSKARPVQGATPQEQGAGVALDFSKAQPINEGEQINDIGKTVIVPKEGENFADTMKRAAAHGKTVTQQDINDEMKTAPKKAAQVLIAAPAIGAGGAAGLAGAGELYELAPEGYKALKDLASTPAGKQAIKYILHGVLGAAGFKGGSKLLELLIGDSTPHHGLPPQEPVEVLGEKKPSKYDVKPLPGGTAPEYQVITSDEAGTPAFLPKQHEQRIRDIINSFSIDKYPEGGIVFVPEKKYNEIRQDIQNGKLFGHPIAQSANSTEHWGQTAGSIMSSKLGDGFTVPQIKRTYLNAALLKDDPRLQEVLAHELGHHAAEAEKHPDMTEEAADRYKDAYLKRGRQTQKLWDDIMGLPVTSRSAALPLPEPLPPQ